MKVIVVYASAGAGHLRAAEALVNCFKQKHPEVEVKLVDILDKSSPIFKFIYINSYNFMVHHASFIWRWIFAISKRGPLSVFARRISTFSRRMNTQAFEEFLMHEDVDVIVSTHFVSPEIAGRLKIKNKIKARLITVITDYDVHPFWISKGTDLYIVASEFTKKRLIQIGIPDKSIAVCGIPVDDKFIKTHDRLNLCQKLRINDDIFTVLIMTGSFGIGPIEKLAKALYKETQAIVVCGKNRKLFIKLSTLNLPGIKVFGFVDNTDELMAVSDVIITKPGGMSVSEILVTELVPIFICAIPGQEEGNVLALRSYGIGQELNKVEQIKNAVLKYRDNPQIILEIKNRIRNIRKPLATQEICNVVCESGNRPTY